MIADHGWKLIPEYRFDMASGRWRHRNGAVEPALRLTDLSYDSEGRLTYPSHDDRAPESALAEYLVRAAELFDSMPPPPDSSTLTVSADFEHLRWFELHEVCLT